MEANECAQVPSDDYRMKVQLSGHVIFTYNVVSSPGRRWTSLLENEELHTSLSMVEEEKGLVERERDNLREMAEQAEELAKIVKSLVTGESEG